MQVAIGKWNSDRCIMELQLVLAGAREPVRGVKDMPFDFSKVEYMMPCRTDSKAYRSRLLLGESVRRTEIRIGVCDTVPAEVFAAMR